MTHAKHRPVVRKLVNAISSISATQSLTSANPQTHHRLPPAVPGVGSASEINARIEALS